MKKIDNRKRIILYYSFSIYAGMIGAIFGPSLLKLGEQTQTTLGQISLIFPTRAVSYLVGSFLAGYLFDKFSGHRLLVGFLPVIGITLGLIPFLGNPLILIAVSMLMAFTISMIDVGCSSLLFKVPEIDIGPAMNGLHFFYGLGSFIAPLVLAGSLQISNGIQWGFWGLALFSLVILIQFINNQEPEKTEDQQERIEGNNLVNGKKIKQIIWMIALFFFAFVGVEIGYGDWLSTYSITSGLAVERTAILLTSTYWGAFTLSRLISIPLATRIRPKMILMMDMVGSLIGLGLIFLFPRITTFLWLGTIILGFSVASLFPTMLTFAESILPMTGRVTSIFFVSGSVGSIILPWLIGRSVENLGPNIIIQALFLTLILAGLFFLALMVLTKKPVGRPQA